MSRKASISNMPNQPIKFKMRRVHCYGQGESFGELALKDESSGQRQARIVTITTCHFITISRADYLRCLKKYEDRIVEEKL